MHSDIQCVNTEGDVYHWSPHPSIDHAEILRQPRRGHAAERLDGSGVSEHFDQSDRLADELFFSESAAFMEVGH